MLPKEHRISKQEEFDLVKSSGKSIHSNSFLFSFFNRNDSSPTRFGFIVTKKVDARATQRNTITRRMRAVVTSLLKDLNLGYDCVVVAHHTSKNTSSETIMQELTEALRKAHILKA